MAECASGAPHPDCPIGFTEATELGALIRRVAHPRSGVDWTVARAVTGLLARDDVAALREHADVVALSDLRLLDQDADQLIGSLPVGGRAAAERAWQRILWPRWEELTRTLFWWELRWSRSRPGEPAAPEDRPVALVPSWFQPEETHLLRSGARWAVCCRVPDD